MKSNFKTVSIPAPLHDKIKEMTEGTGFTSVSGYVTYVLREIVASKSENKGEAWSKKDEEKVRSRLKALGYTE